MQYKVAWVRGNTLYLAIEELETKVKELYTEGYRLQGGISVSVTHSDYYTVCQAMVK